MQRMRLVADAISLNSASFALELAGHWPLGFALLSSLEAADRESEMILKAGPWDHSLAKLEQMVRFRMKLDIVSCNSIISRLSRVGNSLALKLLARLPQLHLKPDLYSVNAAMAFAEWTKALDLLAALSTQLLEADAVSYSTGISACGRALRYNPAQQLLQEAVKSNLANQVVYNAAISACGGRWEQALALLWQTPMDEISFNAAIDACEQGGQWQVALQLLFAARDAGMSSAIGANSALSAMEKCGQLLPALHLLQQLCEEGLANEISFNCAIAACEKTKDWQMAFQLLQDMQMADLSADEISFRAAMSACPSSEWFQVLLLLDTMRQTNIQTSTISFNAALNTLSTAPTAAISGLQLLQRMMKQVDPDAGSYKAAATCCERGGYALQSLPIFEQLNRCLA
eukprot:g22992.t1